MAKASSQSTSSPLAPLVPGIRALAQAQCRADVSRTPEDALLIAIRSQAHAIRVLWKDQNGAQTVSLDPTAFPVDRVILRALGDRVSLHGIAQKTLRDVLQFDTAAAGSPLTPPPAPEPQAPVEVVEPQAADTPSADTSIEGE